MQHDVDNEGGRRSPIEAVFYIAPSCFISGLAAASIFERPALLASPMLAEAHVVGLWDSPLRNSLCMMAIVALFIFVLQLAEFALVALTSSLSMAIFGVLKELLAIVLAAAALGERLTVLNMVGFAICVGGVFCYHGTKGAKEMEDPTGSCWQREGSSSSDNDCDRMCGSSGGGGAGRARRVGAGNGESKAVKQLFM
jgi:uncharacterized membrane protein YgcG